MRAQTARCSRHLRGMKMPHGMLSVGQLAIFQYVSNRTQLLTKTEMPHVGVANSGATRGGLSQDNDTRVSAKQCAQREDMQKQQRDEVSPAPRGCKVR
jgi:hypothetical protein